MTGPSRQPDDPAHVPVLLEACLDLLAPALEGPAPVVIDATLGMGGHSEAILRRFPDVRLVGIDRDPQALRLAGEGMSASEIAAKLNLSQGTVRNYLSEAIGKLGAANRIEAARTARVSVACSSSSASSRTASSSKAGSA